jgi:hypothetical protein
MHVYEKEMRIINLRKLYKKSIVKNKIKKIFYFYSIIMRKLSLKVCA